MHVIVIGVGVVGVAIARTLTRSGASVTLLERGLPGAGASTRSVAGLTGQAQFRLVDPGDEERARAYYDVHRRSRLLWREWEDELGDLGIRWGGLVAWVGHDDDPAPLREEIRRRHAWGGHAEEIDETTLRRLVPGARPDVATGMASADDGSMLVSRALDALTRSVVVAGVDLRTQRGVRGFEVVGGRATTVIVDAGAIPCDAVVVAAGAFSGALLDELGIRLRTRVLDGAFLHLSGAVAPALPTLSAPGLGVVRRADGSVLVTPGDAAYDHPDGVAGDGGDSLHRRAIALLPDLRRLPRRALVTASWALPDDGYPLLGLLPQLDNVFCAITNAGVTLAPELARLLADLVCEGAEPPGAFEPARLMDGAS